MFVYIYIYIYIIFNNFILLLCVDSLVYSGFINILEGVTNTDSDKKKLEDLVRDKTFYIIIHVLECNIHLFFTLFLAVLPCMFYTSRLWWIKVWTRGSFPRWPLF